MSRKPLVAALAAASLVVLAWWALTDTVTTTPTVDDILDTRVSRTERQPLASEARPARPGAVESGVGTPVAGATGTTILEIEVIDHAGAVIPDQLVTLQRHKSKKTLVPRRARTDESGVARFTAVVPGTYLPLIDDENLPDGLSVPIKQERVVRNADAYPEGVYARTVDIAHGETQRLTITLPGLGLLKGVVYDNEGIPMPDTPVRLQNTGAGLQGVVFDVRTDAFGQFESHATEGHYQVHAIFPAEHSHRGRPRPEPAFVLIQWGAVDFVELRPRLGLCSARGRVVDSNDAPVAKIEVIAYAWKEPHELAPGESMPSWASGGWLHVVTDDNGEFVLDGLPCERTKIAVEPHGFTPSRGPLENRLKRFVPSIKIDFPSIDTHDVTLDTVVVDLNPAWELRWAFDFGSVSRDGGVKDEDLIVTVHVAYTAPVPFDGEVSSDGVWVYRRHPPFRYTDIKVADRYERFEPVRHRLNNLTDETRRLVLP